jgi:hypothetical protein
MPEPEEKWRCHGIRVGRTTRTVEVASNDDPDTIEEGTVRFELIHREDQWKWEEDSWTEYLVKPGRADDFSGFEDIVALPHEVLGVIDLPEPMTREEAHQFLEDEPERWREFLDDGIESDTTAADLLEEIQ